MATLSEIAKKVVEVGGIGIVDPLRSVLGKYRIIDENGVYGLLEPNDLPSKLFTVSFLSDEVLNTSSSIPSVLNNVNGYNGKKQNLEIKFNKSIIRQFLTLIGIENITSTLIDEFIQQLKSNIVLKILNNLGKYFFVQ